MTTGAPPKWRRLTDEKVAAALEKAAGLQSVAAEALGVDRSTVCRRVAKSKRLQEVIDAAQEKTVDIAEASLIKAIQRGEAWAVCFFLKCRAKRRGYVERQEITGADGGPIRTSNVEALSDEELEKIARGD